MLEKHLEQIGELTAQKHLEERQVTEAAIQAAIGVVVADIAETKSQIQASIDALEAKPDVDPEALVSTELLNSSLESQAEVHQKAVEDTGAEIRSELADGIDGVKSELKGYGLDLVDGLEEIKKASEDQHAEQIKSLTDQLKSQQTFEAMLTTRLAEIQDGKDGERGEPGEPGLDRPLLEPVELKSGKDYGKNILGTHNGGLWISNKQAVGNPEEDPHSWNCILDAMATLDVDLQEDKTYKMSVRMSTGRHIETEFKIPFPEHKGIWEEGEYKKGQMVTKGHSMWLAMEDTSGEPPGNGWQQIMTAPRGKTGPAGKSIEGPQGKPGRNGRDGKDAEIDWEVQKLFVEGLVYTDKRSASYPLRSFRGHFSENESYLTGDVVRIGYSLSVVTDPIPQMTPYRQATERMESMIMSGSSASTAAERVPYMLWRGDYVSGSYSEGDVVLDGGFTMVSLEDENTDPAAPAAIGEEMNLFDGTLTSFDSTGKQVIFGARVQNLESSVFLNAYSIETVAGARYQVFSVRNPITNPDITELISFTASATGTSQFGLSNILLPRLSLFDLAVLETIPDPAPVTWQGNWDYDTPGNPQDPGNGEWQQPDGTPGIMRVAKIDDDGTDQSANLLAVSIGDIIDSGIRWTVQGIEDMGNWVQIEVSPPTQTAPDGVRQFSFESVPDSQITTGRDVDYWTNNNPDVQGLFGVDTAYGDIIPDGNAYGVNIIYQEAYASEKWDIVAYSPSIQPSQQAVALINESEANWIHASAAPVTSVSVQSTGNQWLEASRVAIPEGRAIGGRLHVIAKSSDPVSYQMSAYNGIAWNDGGTVTSDFNRDYEVGSDDPDIAVRVVSLPDGIAIEVRGRPEQTWDWDIKTFYRNID